MTKTTVVQIGFAVLLTAAGTPCACEEQDLGIVSSPVSEAAGQGATKIDPKQAPPPVLQRRYPRYQVQKADTLGLDFPFTSEFNDIVTVQPDGYISLRGLGDIHVEGKTVPELNESLRTAYAKILHDPVITVTLKDFEKSYFVAFGEVGKPGKYELRGDTTVTQGLAVAGGFTERSKHSQVLLFRRLSGDWAEVKKYDMKKMLRSPFSKNLREDLYLQPGDMLFVPKNAVSKILQFVPFIYVLRLSPF